MTMNDKNGTRENSERLHGAIQDILMGNDTVDCGYALALSLVCVCGWGAESIAEAERAIDDIAAIAQIELVCNWEKIVEALEAHKVNGPSTTRLQ